MYFKNKLGIEIESDDVTWLTFEGKQMIGFSNIDQLIEDLEGAIKVNEDDLTIILLDENKLLDNIIFN